MRRSYEELVKSHPACHSVGDERFGFDDNGIWMYLKDGFIDSESGCHAIHEDSYRKVWQKTGYIKRCDCKDCKK